MKLSQVTIDLENGMVICTCKLEIQGSVVFFPFSVPESDLYSKAAERQADSWDNEDLIVIGSTIVGQPITV